MPGVSKIFHQGHEILLIDYSGCSKDTEMIEILKEAQRIIIEENKEYLQLIDVRGAKAFNSFLREARRIAYETPKLARKRAIVGVDSPGRKVLLEFYNLILGPNKVYAFSTLSEAKDWIIT